MSAPSRQDSARSNGRAESYGRSVLIASAERAAAAAHGDAVTGTFDDFFNLGRAGIAPFQAPNSP